GNDGVVMDGQLQVHLVPDVLLDVVVQVVGVQRVHLGGQLDVQGGELPPPAVVVHHQVMHAQHPRIGQHLFLQLSHQLGGSTLPQQGAKGVLHQAPARPQDKGRHAHAHDAVDDTQAGGLAQHRREQHHAGGNDVVAAVGGGGQQRVGVDGVADGAVKPAEPQLDRDGSQ